MSISILIKCSLASQITLLIAGDVESSFEISPESLELSAWCEKTIVGVSPSEPDPIVPHDETAMHIVKDMIAKI